MTTKLSPPTVTNFKEKYSLPIVANNSSFEWNTYMFPHAFLQVGEDTKQEILKNLFSHAAQYNKQWEINYIRSSDKDILRYSSFKAYINKTEVGVKKGVEVLDYVMSEKDRRYQIMMEENASNYLYTEEPFKTTVLIIDKPEKFLFQIKTEKDFKSFKSINQILRLGRAAGIHLLFLSEEVINPRIQANITYQLDQKSFSN